MLMIPRTLPAVVLILLLLSACTTVKPAAERPAKGTFSPYEGSVRTLTAQLPDYSKGLSSVKGKGKAIVSEPGNTERVTVYFSSNRDRSLVTVKNSIGIEGGQLLTNGDSLLIYNKVDKFARKVDIRSGNLSRIDNLASLNILEMINYTVGQREIDRVRQSDNFYLLHLSSGELIYIMRDKHLVSRVVQPPESELPYAEIIYEGYTEIEGYKLPRRITIFSKDEKSKINLLIQSLNINPELPQLNIELPDNIRVYHQ